MKQYSVDALRCFFSKRDRNSLLLGLAGGCPYHGEIHCSVHVLNNLRALPLPKRGEALSHLTPAEKGKILEECINCAFRLQPDEQPPRKLP